MHNFIKARLKEIGQYEQLSLIFSLIILCIIAAFLSPVFLTGTNMMNVLRSASLTAITGMGMVLVILLGEIDLSVGSTQAVIGIISVTILNATGDFWIAFIATIIAGFGIGLCNGLLVTKAKINSLIATLGTMAILRGVAYVSTGAVSIQVEPKWFSDFGAGYWGPLPKPLVIAILVFVILGYMLNKTAFGRYIYAVGGNAKASELSGISVEKIKILAFVISGVLTALTGFILASRLNSGQPTAGIGFEFQVIAAVILGGISLTGGKGTLTGAMAGVMILSVLQNILILENVSPFYHEIARGAVILLAVYLDGRNRRAAEKKILKVKAA